ncbi:MAG TPA: response regulator [Elusimicrobiales bacterium]|nr:response regulator [Elusimicrobiales bacterium]
MPGKILLADDDKNLLELYTWICRDTDYSFTTASSFAEASGLIEAGHYDLLITDLFFPDGLGTELIRSFGEKYAGSKSLLITGEPGATEVTRLPAGTEYLPKPFTPRLFRAALTKALGG